MKLNAFRSCVYHSSAKGQPYSPITIKTSCFWIGPCTLNIHHETWHLDFVFHSKSSVTGGSLIISLTANFLVMVAGTLKTMALKKVQINRRIYCTHGLEGLILSK